MSTKQQLFRLKRNLALLALFCSASSAHGQYHSTQELKMTQQQTPSNFTQNSSNNITIETSANYTDQLSLNSTKNVDVTRTAQLTADQINLQAGGSVNVGGTIRAGGKVTINGANIVNSGTISGGNVVIHSAGDIVSTGDIHGANITVNADNNLTMTGATIATQQVTAQAGQHLTACNTQAPSISLTGKTVEQCGNMTGNVSIHQAP
jgi:adhesin HecA-like repeat protein